MFRKVGEINSFDEIPLGKEIIITGSVGNAWYWKTKGTFMVSSNGCYFVDECNVYTYFSHSDFISLNMLEKISDFRRPSTTP